MKKIQATSLFLLNLTLVYAQSPLKTFTLRHNNLDRTYHVYQPVGFNIQYSAPLVIALHGGGGTGKQMDAGTNNQFKTEAGKRGWLVVFPDGVEKGWNDGREIVTRKGPQRVGVDDVGFISAMIDRMKADYNIDLHRVYATGISNGGFMSQRLAIELSDRIAAVGIVTANLTTIMQDKTPKQPVGVLYMNGTEDPLVPFDGGAVKVLGQKRGEILSTDESVKWWVQHLGCIKQPEKAPMQDTNAKDGTTTEVETYASCREQVIVKLYRVKGGGHTWPGGKQYLPKKMIGKVSLDFNGTKDVFDFFEKHSK